MSNLQLARVQAWAKGFRVTSPTEEFQLVVPNTLDALRGAEVAFDGHAWPPVLEDLYKGHVAALAHEFALLLQDQEVTLIAVAPSTDQVGRTSIVAVGATTQVSWDLPDTQQVLPLLRALTQRLGASYASTFKGGADPVKDQLRSGRFLPARDFSLAEEAPDGHLPWQQLAYEIARWKGIRGIATLRLCPLGANVLFGAAEELERHPARATVAGYFDPTSGKIHALTDELTLWEAKATIAEVVPPQVRGTDERLDEIASTLRELKSNQETFQKGILGAIDRVVALLDRLSRRKKKKG